MTQMAHYVCLLSILHLHPHPMGCVAVLGTSSPTVHCPPNSPDGSVLGGAGLREDKRWLLPTATKNTTNPARFARGSVDRGCGLAQRLCLSFIKDLIEYSGRLHADPWSRSTDGTTPRATRVRE
jgi:hypothetical protein